MLALRCLRLHRGMISDIGVEIAGIIMRTLTLAVMQIRKIMTDEKCAITWRRSRF